MRVPRGLSTCCSEYYESAITNVSRVSCMVCDDMDESVRSPPREDVRVLYAQLLPHTCAVQNMTGFDESPVTASHGRIQVGAGQIDLFMGRKTSIILRKFTLHKEILKH